MSVRCRGGSLRERQVEPDVDRRRLELEAGVDLTKPDAIEAGLAEFESVVAEMERIVASGALDRPAEEPASVA